MKYSEVQSLIRGAQHILVLQADNPDGDSLGSALALEAIFNEMGKRTTLVCTVDIPSYLRHMNGWDRVGKEIPAQFDITVIVDSSTESLFENTSSSMEFGWIKSKPVIVLDHHVSSGGLTFADVSIVEPVVATSELIFNVATELEWPLPVDACEFMALSILSDSLGLMTESTTADSFRVMAGLVERGANLAKLDAARRELMKKDPVLLNYKGILLQRAELSLENRLATIVIPWSEIERFSPLYNPTMLIVDDLRMTDGVAVVIGYKVYQDGRITAKIRSNYGYPIANEIASAFGGGGHVYASGFKIQGGATIEDLQNKVANRTRELLDKESVKS